MSKNGFTLVEILVVIGIISILIGIFSYSYIGVVSGQKITATEQFINGLDSACMNYHTDFKEYPPMTYEGSKNLHYYLGQPLEKPMGFDDSGLPLPTKEVGPYFKFKSINFKGGGSIIPDPPRSVIDIWQRTILYENPGTNNTDGVDIISKGEYPKSKEGWITNY